MINSNGSQFLLLDGAADFGASGQTCRWDAGLRAFTLTRQDTPRLPRPQPDSVRTRHAAATPLVLDEHGQLGRLSDDRRRLECAIAGPAGTWAAVRAERDPADGPAADLAAALLDPVDAPAGTRFTDLHLGGSGLLALPWSDGATRHGLTVVSLTRRWQRRCSLDFLPSRAWVDASDRVWLAGVTTLGQARGAPLPQPYTPHPDRFEPLPTEPDPLRQIGAVRVALPPHRGLLALAADATRLCLLAEAPDSTAEAPRMQVFSRPLDAPATRGFTTHPLPPDLPLASDLLCLGDGRVLLLVPLDDGPDPARGHDDCPLLALPERDGAAAELLGERWPRRAALASAVRFVRHRDGHPRTLTPQGLQRLYRLAQARYPTRGRAILSQVLDAGAPDTLWDVLRLDACIPAGCSLGVAVQCGDDRTALPDVWHAQPEPLRLPQASELPFATGPAQAALHEILLQREDGAVRALRGRYLRLRLTLTGDGRHSPAVFAMRLWHPRQSWQSRYLPEHFHQQARPATPSATPAPTPTPANGADLRERLLASFEKLLTPLEDRIAAAEVLLDPAASPATHLPWLASFLGAQAPRHWPVARQRRWIARQGALQARRGSYHGLLEALDILTDGAVARGQVIPVEHFRLRRTMATLLGLDLDDAQHPLTLGTGLSGNSLVGESLILSDDHAREFLALFAPEVAASRGESAVVERFFDACARRLTVVLHGPARALATVVTEALPTLVPATVQWAVRPSDHPFVLGLSPLLGIDTWLERTPPPAPVVLDRTRLGRGHVLRGPVALAPEHARPTDPNALDTPDAAGDPP